MSIRLQWVGPALFGAAACAALYWVRRDLRVKRQLVAPRDLINRSSTRVLLGLLPIMFFLLRFGEPHGLTDQIGVIIASGLWFFLPHVLNPWTVARS